MYSVSQLSEAISKSICWSDVCRNLNITICSVNFKRIQKLCREHNLNIEHFSLKRAFRRNKKNWESVDIYCLNSTFPRAQLRKKVLDDNYMPYVCAGCHNGGIWRDFKLTLEIEHKNGINDDHRKENLEWLCPNCHSQTSTYRNKTNRVSSLGAKSSGLISR